MYYIKDIFRDYLFDDNIYADISLQWILYKMKLRRKLK